MKSTILMVEDSIESLRILVQLIVVPAHLPLSSLSPAHSAWSSGSAARGSGSVPLVVWPADWPAGNGRIRVQRINRREGLGVGGKKKLPGEGAPGSVYSVSASPPAE